MTIATDIQSLSPSSIIELFDIDTSGIITGGSLYHFHAGTNGIVQPVVWNGITYTPLPIEASGFDLTTKGTLPRPALTIANINGLFSSLVYQNDDLVGALVTRRRTLLKYIDAINFANQNLLSYTELFDNAIWAKTNSTVIANAQTDPNGDITAETISRVATGNNYISQQYNTTAHANNTYTFSVYLRSGSMTGNMALRIKDGAGNQLAVTSFAITTDWVRYSVSGTFGATPSANIVVYIDPSNDAGSAGDTFYAWGAQLEAGPVATDYKPIVSSWNPTADPSQKFNDEIWYIDQKTSENKYTVSWELASAFDLQGVMLPYRQVIENSCSWDYRGPECGYSGTNYFDRNDQPCASSVEVCGKRLTSCKLRFGTATLPFGGFPGTVRYG